jgi:uncharacterized protein YjbI with pentapeptide repeats
MADETILTILRQGVNAWNAWYRDHPQPMPDLSGADLSGADLKGINLGWVNLTGANLSGGRFDNAHLMGAHLSGADLSHTFLDGANMHHADLAEANVSWSYLREGATLSWADLSHANLCHSSLDGADLTLANLSDADLRGACLAGANLTRAGLPRARLHSANLERALLIDTDFTGADLQGCRIFGISAWGVKLNGATQADMILTQAGKPIITVGDLEVAQFIYLLLNNQKLRDVIDTVTSKVVLILGRFTEQRKRVLDALKGVLTAPPRGYVPVLFDFQPSASRDLTETIMTLAHMAKFIIADITDAQSIPQELSHIVPHLPSVPIQPILLASQWEYAMFEHWRRYTWVLPEFRYHSEEHLLASLDAHVIAPAEARRAAEIDMRALRQENEDLRRRLAEMLPRDDKLTA